MYILAAVHFGIDLRCLFEDVRQSRALQASALSYAATNSSAQCLSPDSVSDATSPVSNFESMLIERTVLLSSNVSDTISRCSCKADDPVVLIRLC